MRDIRFRVYNSHIQEFEYYALSSIIHYQSRFQDSIINGRTFEQFSGLTDKNGKQIYEGDIVEDERTGATGTVIFEEGEFNCGNTFEYKGFVELCVRGRIEVIGNIREGIK